MTGDNDDYTETSMRVLAGLEPVRKRPTGPGFSSEFTDVLTLQNAANYLGCRASLLELALEDGSLKSLMIADLDAYLNLIEQEPK